jgi:hypothetical protein
MTRQLRWQLGAIAAAAAGLLAVAQAQIADTSTESQVTAEAPAVMSEPATEADVKAVMDNEQVLSTMPAAPVDPVATPSAAPVTAAAPVVEQPTQIVVVPTTVDQAAVAAKAWATVEAMPITREDVVAEAVYANQNGLIPRGELSIVNEDKGSAYVEQADQARHARSTQQYMARLDAKHQQFFAVEQERLNQLALQEQQRQQALAAQQAQQQQLAQQAQPTQ